mmetsp:Transcript_34134/g.61184  ORF Transcript_34134/g.61184 Transcript_34134/m.61184 type:complete len:148 (-) Transcript_34134:571-1014(-)
MNVCASQCVCMWVSVLVLLCVYLLNPRTHYQTVKLLCGCGVRVTDSSNAQREHKKTEVCKAWEKAHAQGTVLSGFIEKSPTPPVPWMVPRTEPCDNTQSHANQVNTQVGSSTGLPIIEGRHQSVCVCVCVRARASSLPDTLSTTCLA